MLSLAKKMKVSTLFCVGDPNQKDQNAYNASPPVRTGHLVRTTLHWGKVLLTTCAGLCLAIQASLILFE